MTKSFTHRIGAPAMALAALAAIGITAATPAHADWHDRGWHGHYYYHHYHPGVVYAPPPVYYAPPAAYYAPPPPVYYAPQPSLNVVLPLRF